MSDPERFHRDDPERTTPRRGMVGSDPSDPWNVRAPLFSADRTEDDTVDKGVNAAYRVMNEHLREGRQSAERAANRWDQEVPPGRGSLEDIRSLAHRIVSIYADSIPILIDFIQSLGSGLLSGYQDYRTEPSTSYGRDRSRHAGFGGSAWRRGDDSANLALEVSSKRRLRITVDVAEPDNPNLIVPALVALDPAKSPLRQVSFIANGGRQRTLRIMVPDDQPAGIYTGAIVDERTGAPGGLLSVAVLED